MTTKAVFLDRDGTICEEVNYLSKVEQVRILPGVPGAIKMLNEGDFKVIVITNQSGVSRGYFTLNALQEINEHIVCLLEREGAKIDDIYFCPHHPDDNCDCRKPKLGLVKKAVMDHHIDLPSSFLVGDRLQDVATGKQAGCKTILVMTGYGSDEVKKIHNSDSPPDHISTDLFDAASWIIEKGKEGF